MGLAVDGTPVSNNSTAQTIVQSFTSTLPNDIILVFVRNAPSANSGSTVSGVAASGLSFTRRSTVTYNSTTGITATLELWYAIAASTFTGNITVTFNSASTYTGRMYVMAVNGANMSTPFDINGTLPNQITTASTSTIAGSLSTTNPNTLLVGFIGLSGTGNPTHGIPAGWSTVLSANGFSGISDKLVSATQSTITPTWTISSETSALGNGLLVDAVQAGQIIPYPWMSTTGNMRDMTGGMRG